MTVSQHTPRTPPATIGAGVVDITIEIDAGSAPSARNARSIRAT